MKASEETQIPDKMYFKIGEVSRILGVKPYVLRYWETEFKELMPVKSSSNQRLYKRKDVQLLVKVRDLLYKEKFTINGARKRLKEEKADTPPQMGLAFDGNAMLALSGAQKNELVVGIRELMQEIKGVI